MPSYLPVSHYFLLRAHTVCAYMRGHDSQAPEAFTGRASKATDGYSFGVCLWELLCGRTPYSDVQGGGCGGSGGLTSVA